MLVEGFELFCRRHDLANTDCILNNSLFIFCSVLCQQFHYYVSLKYYSVLQNNPDIKRNAYLGSKTFRNANGTLFRLQLRLGVHIRKGYQGIPFRYVRLTSTISDNPHTHICNNNNTHLDNCRNPPPV